MEFNMNNQIDNIVHSFIKDEFTQRAETFHSKFDPNELWKQTRLAGSLLWLDTGDLEAANELWNPSFSALTTNNTLLNNEIQKGIYDDLIPKAAHTLRSTVPQIEERQLVQEIAFILNAFHGLRLVKTFNAFVSVELHTDFANDIEQSIAFAHRFYTLCPEKFIIKIPMTSAGFITVQKLSKQGIPINFTLGFSARQNYLAALFSHPTYVNIFMGRLNAFISGNQLGDGKNIGEKTTRETQNLLYELRNQGKTKTKLIGASIRNGEQLAAVIGTDVLTMPTTAASEYMAQSPQKVKSQMSESSAINLNSGIILDDFNGQSLWEVSPTFQSCVDDLLKIEQLTAKSLQDHFSEAGLPDFLPNWSEEEQLTITQDGKIPVFNTWKEKLGKGTIALDALMNVSALHSFTTDQEKLDKRILSLI